MPRHDEILLTLASAQLASQHGAIVRVRGRVLVAVLGHARWRGGLVNLVDDIRSALGDVGKGEIGGKRSMVARRHREKASQR